MRNTKLYMLILVAVLLVPSISHQFIMQLPSVNLTSAYKHQKELVGKTYADSIFAYVDSAVMGLQFADGTVKVNPPMDYKIQKGD